MAFQPQSDAFTVASIRVLKRLAQDLLSAPDAVRLHVSVVAAGETGDDELLARKRTLFVMRYLMSLNVPPARLRAVEPVGPYAELVTADNADAVNVGIPAMLVLQVL